MTLSTLFDLMRQIMEVRYCRERRDHVFTFRFFCLSVRFGVMLLMEQSSPTKSAAVSIAVQSRYNHR